MAFPINPTDGQIYNGYIYKSERWIYSNDSNRTNNGIIYKTKKYTGTTASSQGTGSPVLYNLNFNKIVAAYGVITCSDTMKIMIGAVQDAYKAQIEIYSDHFSVYLHPTLSANLLSKPFIVYIVYEE